MSNRLMKSMSLAAVGALLHLTAPQGSAQGFTVSQSFEPTTPGHPFTTNIVDNGTGWYADFNGALFRGTSFPRDYVAIWPLHADDTQTSPTILSDDGPLALVTGLDGNHFLAVEDSRFFPVDESNQVVDYLLMNFAPLDITEVTEVEVSLNVAAPRGAGYANGISGNDVSDISVRLVVDGQAPVVIGQFRGTTSGYNRSLALDADFDGLGEGTQLDAALRNFSFTAPVSGSSLVVQLRVESRQNNQEIAVDNVRIRSTALVPVELSGFSVE